MTRRVFLGGALAPLVCVADAADETWTVVAGMAAGLAEDNAEAFLKPVDRKMPGYGTLDRNVRAMLDQAEAQSSIETLSNVGQDNARTLQLDWQLRLKRKNVADSAPRILTREEAVTIEFRKDGKKWLVVRIEPAGFFAPPDFG